MSTLDITMVQTAPYWESIDENLLHFTSLLAGCPKTDVVVLPEMFTTGFSMRSGALAQSMEGSAITWMAETANRLDAHICGSVIIESDGAYWNRLVWMSPSGENRTYDKRHLFRMSNEHDHYSAGNERLSVTLNGFTICPLICYDLRFPAWSRNGKSMATDVHRTTDGHGSTDINYDLLIYVANWPKARSEHWRTLLRARSIENLCYTVGVNRIGTDGNNTAYQGDSMTVDFRGEILTPLNSKESIVTVSVDLDLLAKYRSKFPAYLDADRFTIV